MTPCARSHSIPGQHAPGCTCTRECPDHDDHCRGCAPAEATKGLLCGRCSQRMRDNLGASEGLDPDNPVHGLPWAYDALADAYPSLSQAPGGGGSSVDDPEAERLAAVLSVRDGIHDVMGAWMEALQERHRLTPMVVELPRRHLDRSGLQRLLVHRQAAWLLVHVEALEAHEAVAEAWQELADLMSRAHALAPWRPAPTHIDGVPCRCGQMGLHDHGDMVKCWKCGYTMDREQYRVLTTVYARRWADDPRAVGAARAPLPKLEESTEMVDVRTTLQALDDEAAALKDALDHGGVDEEAGLKRWSELMDTRAKLQALLEPMVSGFGGRP